MLDRLSLPVGVGERRDKGRVTEKGLSKSNIRPGLVMGNKASAAGGYSLPFISVCLLQASCVT